jgi:hypothetical protein
MNGISAALVRATNLVPRRIRDTLYVRLFGWLKVPMIAYVRPIVEHLDDDRCVVRIPLSRRSRNHVRSMYVGAFAVGGDIAGGLLALRAAQRRDVVVVPIFRDFYADFFLRAEGDVLFTCTDGPAIKAGVEQAITSGQRVNLPVHVTATVPSKRGVEPVAHMTMTLSIRRGGAAGQLQPLTEAPSWVPGRV